MVHISGRARSVIALPPAPDFAPVQERSRRTLERILAAAESLLGEQLLEDVAMLDIAKRARIAVGTIYLRFPSKESIVPALFDRHNAVVGARVGAMMQSLAGEPALRTRIELLVEFTIRYHVEHRGLLRALTTYTRANPSAASNDLFRQREAMYTAVAHLLVGDSREMRRDDALDAAVFALGVLNSVCREQLLFEDVAPLGRRRKRAAFATQLVDLIERQLAGIVHSPRSGSRTP